MKKSLGTVLLFLLAAAILLGAPWALQRSVTSSSRFGESTIIAEVLKTFLATVAFVVAVYTLFSRDSRLRAHAENLLISLITFTTATILLIASYVVALLLPNTSGWASIPAFLTLFAFEFYCLAFLAMFYLVFLRAYNQFYNLRTDKLIKYFKPIRILRSVMAGQKRYELSCKRRDLQKPFVAAFGSLLSDEERQTLAAGATILLIGPSRGQLVQAAMTIMAERLDADETVNYATFDRPPLQIWKTFEGTYKDLKHHRSDFVFIDAFSPNYAFLDDIQVEVAAQIRDIGIPIVLAKSLAGVHTATARAFNIIKHQDKQQKSEVRRPMTMCYAFSASLCELEGIEQFSIFWRHVIPSERSYGMLTLILEDSYASPDSLRHLRQLADFCFVYVRDLQNGRPSYQLTRDQ